MTTDDKHFLTSCLSPNDAAAVEAKLFALYKDRVNSYTMHESSSVRTETAQELFASVCLTINEGLNKNGLPQAALVTADLEKLFFDGVAQLEKKVKLETQLFIRVCNSLPPFKNLALSESLESISGFKHKYQHRYFADDIPCEIMYPLCVQPPETLRGVNYVLSWLQCLEAENKIINSFDPQAVEALLRKSCQNFSLLTLNLCDPVLTNALAKAFAGEDPTRLNVTDETRRKIACDFSQAGKQNIFEAVAQNAAQTLCDALQLNSSFLRSYAEEFALNLRSRLITATKNDTLGNIFVSF